MGTVGWSGESIVETRGELPRGRGSGASGAISRVGALAGRADSAVVGTSVKLGLQVVVIVRQGSCHLPVPVLQG